MVWRNIKNGLFSLFFPFLRTLFSPPVWEFPLPPLYTICLEPIFITGCALGPTDNDPHPQGLLVFQYVFFAGNLVRVNSGNENPMLCKEAMIIDSKWRGKFNATFCSQDSVIYGLSRGFYHWEKVCSSFCGIFLQPIRRCSRKSLECWPRFGCAAYDHIDDLASTYS